MLLSQRISCASKPYYFLAQSFLCTASTSSSCIQLLCFLCFLRAHLASSPLRKMTTHLDLFRLFIQLLSRLFSPMVPLPSLSLGHRILPCRRPFCWDWEFSSRISCATRSSSPVTDTGIFHCSGWCWFRRWFFVPLMLACRICLRIFEGRSSRLVQILWCFWKDSLPSG